MPNDNQISNRFLEIAAFISDAQNWALADPRLDSHFAAYACVLLSGAIEASVERIVALKMQVLGDNETANYVIKVVGSRLEIRIGVLSTDCWGNLVPHTSFVG